MGVVRDEPFRIRNSVTGSTSRPRTSMTTRRLVYNIFSCVSTKQFQFAEIIVHAVRSDNTKIVKEGIFIKDVSPNSGGISADSIIFDNQR